MPSIYVTLLLCWALLDFMLNNWYPTLCGRGHLDLGSEAYAWSSQLFFSPISAVSTHYSLYTSLASALLSPLPILLPLPDLRCLWEWQLILVTSPLLWTKLRQPSLSLVKMSWTLHSPFSPSAPTSSMSSSWDGHWMSPRRCVHGCG